MSPSGNHILVTLVELATMVALLTGCGQVDRPGPEGEITLEVVSYKQLKEAIKAQQGKVIVVDVWGEYCAPCKKEFPNLVKLHDRYSKEGLVCMSVSIDSEENDPSSLAFLKSKGATFSNFRMEKPEELTSRWRFSYIPAVFVFDQKGKRYSYISGDPIVPFSYANVEAKVKELIRSKQVTEKRKPADQE